MKYNLDNVHWQEFEQIAFRILQKQISPAVDFIEGGGDKGRDIVYNGQSEEYRKEWKGKWIFQAKHKSTKEGEKKALNALLQDLKRELKKVFLTNKLSPNNYVIVTNLTMPGKYYDKLHEIFDEFKKQHNIKCENFDVISYRHIESIIDNQNDIKWAFPNIISHPDFQLLIKEVIDFKLQVRKKAWFNSILKLTKKFVNTRFFDRANSKLKDYSTIILSGPPKSGKTFNAEILALNYYVHKKFEPVLVEDPEDIESFYDENISQIFICDDAFGQHSLSYHAEEWFRKFNTIINLADEKHLFVFTSREYVFRAFVNKKDPRAKEFLEKILVESHNYSNAEKYSLLHRYTLLSELSEEQKLSILDDEDILIEHEKFSPETIRSFFANIPKNQGKKIIRLLKEHLDKPDAYLSHVFFNLDEPKKAALLSVLCSLNNSSDEIYKSFSNICEDLKINQLTSTKIEFDELDDSILRILKHNEIININYYHPSMQEFLIRLLVDENTGPIRNIVLKNFNLNLLNISYVKTLQKTIFKHSESNEIGIDRSDIDKFNIGLERLLKNSELKIFHVTWILEWFCLDIHTIFKLTDRPLRIVMKESLALVVTQVETNDFFYYHKNESIERWVLFFTKFKYACIQYSLELSNINFTYLQGWIKETKDKKDYWKVVFTVLEFTDDKFIMQNVGEEWLNNFFVTLKDEIYDLGNEVFGSDFPKFEQYERERKNNPSLERMKNKPGRTWYPKFLICKEKIKTLKKVQKFDVGQRLLRQLYSPYGELDRFSDYAKNRHNFIVKKGWWD